MSMTEKDYEQKWLKNVLSTEPADFELSAKGIYEIYEYIGQGKPLCLTASSPLMTVATGRMAYFFIEAIKPNLDKFKPFNNPTNIRELAEFYFTDKALALNDAKSFIQKDGIFPEKGNGFVSSNTRYEEYVVQASERLTVELVEDVLTKVFAYLAGEQTKTPAKDKIATLTSLTFMNESKKMAVSDLWDKFFNDVKEYFNLRHPGKYGSAYSEYADIKQHIKKEELPDEKEFRAYEKPILGSSIVWMVDNVFVICDREQELHVDSETKPHNEKNAAIVYRDGIKKYYIHGIKLNEKIIMRPHEITLEEIDNERDNDKRSIMIDRLGWIKYLDMTEASPIDERENPVENTVESLWRLKDKTLRFIATCPTGKLVSLPVLDTLKTCEEAQLWMGQNTNRKYNVIGRT